MKISLRRVFSLILLTSVLSLSVDIKDRDGIRIVRKRIKIPIRRENDEELTREGRNLGLLTPLADFYLKLQCSLPQCQASLSTAQICCQRNFNLNCCYYIQSHLYFTPSPPVTQRPVPAFGLPFSLGLSFELTQRPHESLHPLGPPIPHHHDLHHDYQHDLQHDHHHDIDHDLPPPHYGSQHHRKPGSCPQPDRDYYNRPGYSQSIYDTIPRVPGYHSPHYSSFSCSYDDDCPRSQKCCHLKIGHHQIVMVCRHPSQDPWLLRSIQDEDD